VKSLALAVMVLTATPALAEWANGSGWFIKNQIAARAFPAGAFDEARVGYQWGWPSGRSVSAAFNLSVTPAFIRAGATFEARPFSFIDVFATGEAGRSFGNLGLEQSFANESDASSIHGPDFNRLFSTQGGRPTWRYQVMVGVVLHAHVGRVFGKSNTRFVTQGLSLPAGHDFFYDPNWEVFARNRGVLVVGDNDVLVQVVPGLRVGARYNITHAFGVDGPGATGQRLGPLVSYLVKDDPNAALGMPTVSLVVNWWLQPPFASTTPSRAVPFIGVAFTFNSRLG
jgi:hypothetical protein